jgi:hypothetical protein
LQKLHVGWVEALAPKPNNGADMLGFAALTPTCPVPRFHIHISGTRHQVLVDRQIFFGAGQLVVL